MVLKIFQIDFVEEPYAVPSGLQSPFAGQNQRSESESKVRVRIKGPSQDQRSESGSKVRVRVVVGRPFAFVGHAVRFVEPHSQIDLLTAAAAKRHVLGLRSLERLAAIRAPVHLVLSRRFRWRTGRTFGLGWLSWHGVVTRFVFVEHVVLLPISCPKKIHYGLSLA